MVSARPPLLLWLLCLSLELTGAGTRRVIVLAPNEVRGFLDQTVTLPCNLQPLEPGVQVTQVTWMRREPSGNAHSVAVFHPTQGPSFPHPERLQFAKAKTGVELQDASLMVSGLRAEDEANYTCEFATFPQGSGSAQTWLRVFAEPQNQVEIQEDLLGTEPVAKARCVSTGGRPPARISWSSSLQDRNVTMTQTPGPLPGTFNVTSIFNFIPSSLLYGQNVTCRVEHETFKEPVLLKMTLAVRYPPEVSISGYDDNWYLGRNEVTLNCDVRSNPEPTNYVWSTTTGSLPPSAVTQGSRLLVHTVDESINTTFICHVTNDLGTRQAELTVLLKDEPPGESKTGSFTVIISIVGVLIVALCLAVIAFWKFRKSRRSHSNPSANKDSMYVPVSTPQDLQGQNAQGDGRGHE
ncbi:PREDICTED: poliovirus receptor homolog [Condylura cristata]|uniref:poliovirus receptor homolog n=1 Tax=Condylura cristata TaxID=143302 RepID=UPI000643CB08|nr:PREDICTED: poliovirus receptor homolog [Condylura cristata]